MKSKKFKQKVQAMTAKEIIMSMVEGLQDPVTEIKMSTFFRNRNNVCYGCAATNAICKIEGLTVAYLKGHKEENTMSRIYGDTDYFMNAFEIAIDKLRIGLIAPYNTIARVNGFAEIKEAIEVPRLKDNYTQNDLNQYIELANTQ